jgi:hypothetical protein
MLLSIYPHRWIQGFTVFAKFEIQSAAIEGTGTHRTYHRAWFQPVTHFMKQALVIAIQAHESITVVYDHK